MELEQKQEIQTELSEDQILESALDKHYGVEAEETPAEGSPAKETDQEETEETEDAGADQPKKGESEETEETEGKDPRDQMFRKGYNEAKAKYEARLAELEKNSVQPDVLAKMEEFKQVTSSPEYIRSSMRVKGFTEEAIAKTLKEQGHEVPEVEQNDLDMVLNTLNIKRENLSDEGRQYIDTYIADAARVADIIVQNKVDKMLEGRIKPLMEGLNSISTKTEGQRHYEAMKTQVEKEGVLDFEKDVEPVLAEYMEKNPQATQIEIVDHFRELNHKLAIERLSKKEKKDARDGKKEQQRGNVPGAINRVVGEMPKMQPGQKFDDFLDGVLDHAGVRT